MLFPRKIALPLSYYILQGFSQELPTVDLGYQIHQANSFNGCQSRFVRENILNMLIGDWPILQLFIYQICAGAYGRPSLDTTSTSVVKSNICPNRWRRKLLSSGVRRLVPL